MKKVVILGSTGSIGKQTLSVIDSLPNDFLVVGLACSGKSLNCFRDQINKYKPEIVAVYDEEKAKILSKEYPGLDVECGIEGLKNLAQYSPANFIIVAINGLIALFPLISAINSGKTIGIANKESFVSSGEFILSLVKEKKATLIPIDSEHCGIFQCLQGEKTENIKKVILTASGGPFLNVDVNKVDGITVEEVLKHPNWNMGKKITVDCSNLVNKGLELIEARWLFDLKPDQIKAVIHPKSYVHSFVEFIDNSIKAQISYPSMSYSIQYALTWPERKISTDKAFNFSDYFHLEFYPIKQEKFPAFFLAKDVLNLGASYPCVFNAANEVLVERFLSRKIKWKEIVSKLDLIIQKHRVEKINSIEDVLSVDEETRERALVI